MCVGGGGGGLDKLEVILTSKIFLSVVFRTVFRKKIRTFLRNAFGNARKLANSSKERIIFLI